MADITVEADPVGGFGDLMNKAAEVAGERLAEAPYGYTTDADGTTRPKLAAGRPKKPPSVEELKAATTVNEAVPGADRAPEVVKRTRSRGRKAEPKPEKPVPQFREGVIAKGVNKLYRKAGKVIRAMDQEIGQAVIDATKKEDDEDVTVGEAWEELARTNPRIRRWLMGLIAGGAWAQLFWVHAPILLAVLMKPVILKHIPFSGVIESLAEPDEDTPEGEGGLPGGMTADDARAMAALAQAQATKMGMSIPPEVAEKMAQMAGSMMGAGPPGTVRSQPRRTTRAQRNGHP